MIGYVVYKGVLIAVDLFSTKKTAIKPGEVLALDDNKPLDKQLYEAISGNIWDEGVDRLDKLMTEVLEK